MAKRPNRKRLEWAKIPFYRSEIRYPSETATKGILHNKMSYEWKRVPYGGPPPKVRKAGPAPMTSEELARPAMPVVQFNKRGNATRLYLAKMQAEYKWRQRKCLVKP